MVKLGEAVALVRVSREHKCNAALDSDTIRARAAFSAHPPDSAKAAVLTGDGRNFCAGRHRRPRGYDLMNKFARHASHAAEVCAR